jgi:hypothetical protein
LQATVRSAPQLQGLGCSFSSPRLLPVLDLRPLPASTSWALSF